MGLQASCCSSGLTAHTSLPFFLAFISPTCYTRVVSSDPSPWRLPRHLSSSGWWARVGRCWVGLWAVKAESSRGKQGEFVSGIGCREDVEERPHGSLPPLHRPWNISNDHYWASVVFTAIPFFAIAAAWFTLFGISLGYICLCYCCFPREPYGYSRLTYALSLIFLMLFTLVAIIGSVVLYMGQGRFHTITSDTLTYVVSQANATSQKLKDVSEYLAMAKQIGVGSFSLPADVQSNIDAVESKINSSAATISNKTTRNSKNIQDGLDSKRLSLVLLAAVMLFLAFLGFLFSALGLQCLVYLGVHPAEHTALDDIIPCVDNATAQESLLRSKDVTYQLVGIVNIVITNVANQDFPPSAGPFYFNQSGPQLPTLCSRFNVDLTNRQCASGEVDFNNATEVQKNYVCQVSSSGICVTPGRLTPAFYDQMVKAENVSYGLYHYGPFLVGLQDCSFLRETFSYISKTYCPDLSQYSRWVYIGLVMVSAAVMLSLIFWSYMPGNDGTVFTQSISHRCYKDVYICIYVYIHESCSE
ncbi:hypothetical protein MLD38_006671 [Melastoma candidum]|uniref:Uncharacterized protein n=1 Tax=Melastoma candidum TaxID=119954 RepID=A0ACB9RNL9_9MYRT|nr:hypothetical protein MLD38_006671 [Melastoma candidum]